MGEDGQRRAWLVHLRVLALQGIGLAADGGEQLEELAASHVGAVFLLGVIAKGAPPVLGGLR